MSYPRIAFYTVGCKLNHYETEALKASFDRRGYRLVPFGAEAEIYIINTCTVTHLGDADSRRAVRRACRTNPRATVVATGCYAQRRPEELRRAGAHLIVGNDQKACLEEYLETYLTGQSLAEFGAEKGSRPKLFLQLDRSVEGGRTRGTLQIQDGCDEHCTYCIIPQVRGPSVSRSPEEILAQARRMVEAGYRELALTGVHSGSYGRDLDRPEALVELLAELEKIEGLVRLRLNSIEPAYLSDELVEFAASSSKLCRHFHLPLQSGDNGILKRMGRQYTCSFYAGRLERIAARIPDCAIGADVMVGFPGEGEEAFANTFSFLADLPITYLHVFSYSRRAGTPAARLPGHHSPATKKARARQLIALGRQKRLAFHRRFLGRELEVLVEGGVEETSELRTGLSDNYVRVLFPGSGDLVNRLVRVRVVQAGEQVVFGERVGR